MCRNKAFHGAGTAADIPNLNVFFSLQQVLLRLGVESHSPFVTPSEWRIPGLLVDVYIPQGWNATDSLAGSNQLETTRTGGGNAADSHAQHGDEAPGIAVRYPTQCLLVFVEFMYCCTSMRCTLVMLRRCCLACAEELNAPYSSVFFPIFIADSFPLRTWPRPTLMMGNIELQQTTLQ